jgi:hypothetical protein
MSGGPYDAARRLHAPAFRSLNGPKRIGSGGSALATQATFLTTPAPGRDTLASVMRRSPKAMGGG